MIIRQWDACKYIIYMYISATGLVTYIIHVMQSVRPSSPGVGGGVDGGRGEDAGSDGGGDDADGVPRVFVKEGAG